MQLTVLAISVHKEFSIDYLQDQKHFLPIKPRIAFRDITNRTNRRTMIASILPPKTFITNTGPVFVFTRGDCKDEAFFIRFFFYTSRLVC